MRGGVAGSDADGVSPGPGDPASAEGTTRLGNGAMSGSWTPTKMTRPAS